MDDRTIRQEPVSKPGDPKSASTRYWVFLGRSRQRRLVAQPARAPIPNANPSAFSGCRRTVKTTSSRKSSMTTRLLRTARLVIATGLRAALTMADLYSMTSQPALASCAPFLSAKAVMRFIVSPPTTAQQVLVQDEGAGRNKKHKRRKKFGHFLAPLVLLVVPSRRLEVERLVSESHFLALFSSAYLRFIASEIFLRAAALIVRLGLTPAVEA